VLTLVAHVRYLRGKRGQGNGRKVRYADSR
jgi:hypothetical protein